MSRRLFAVGIVIAALLGGLSVWVFRVGPNVDVEILQGQGARDVGRVLKNHGVIASPLLFRALAKTSGLHKDLRPGIFRLRRHMSAPEALWRLTHDRVIAVKILIPEGWMSKQIAERLEANGIVPTGEFFPIVQRDQLEGYLYPTTYFLHHGMQSADVIKMMRQEFAKQAEPILRSKPVPLNEREVLTLASIVEREAVKPEERPMIAAVYLNRLRKKMRLEADPTVQYALGRETGHWKKGLTHADLAFASPYNTYANKGLPPGPICSPSRESIKASLEPAFTNALYFVANNTGGHTFNETFEEHLKAKALAAQERRRNKWLKQFPKR
ncbi:MAG: endolytic transglycosylase MltG [Elusimicrobia bacterium]|nr:endolytic transglycosylase MltG [Elusimicrobiota bacterium]